MKDTRKRQESEVPATEVAVKRVRLPPEECGGGCGGGGGGVGVVDSAEEYSFVDEESVMEVMKLLEEELCRSTTESINGGSPVDETMKQPSMISYSSPLMTSSSSSSSSFSMCSSSCSLMMTESCGASFSDSGSTVMADVDASGISILFDQLTGIDEWTAAAKATEDEDWWWPEAEAEDDDPPARSSTSATTVTMRSG
ncbi:hypothetical protein Sjap_019812 [Stephania japonica]|uniref:Uncharacterized protein n=1 Tax=Stephania japonica TaxID=461633 RepID=A0AAP0F4S6_9MAGN